MLAGSASGPDGGCLGWVQTLWLSPAWRLCRGLDPEEPIVSTANLCLFNHLEVTVRTMACSCLYLHPPSTCASADHLQVTADVTVCSCLCSVFP